MKYAIFAIGIIAILAGPSSNPYITAFGVILSIGVAIYQFSEDQKNERQIKERAFPFSPDDWLVEHQEGVPVSAKLVIPPEVHGYGENVSVRIEQTENKRWDLAEPRIENGRITITYAPNNFPCRGIGLIVYISARG